MSDRHLVWLRGLRGPVPQILHTAPGDAPQLADSLKGHVLTTPRKLGERHDGLSLGAIAALHPPPPPREED